MSKKLFLPLWALGSFLLFIYSFTQVDLSLTLSQASIFQTVQKSFQYIGWFNRPLSTVFYVVLFIFLFSLYFWSLSLVRKQVIKTKTLWTTIIVVFGITVLSYNAFSYDLFNYIFDAKIVTFYNQNPYMHKALDFPQDQMLSFMRWTHRVYPYGPLWLAFTVPISFFGLQIFSLTLLLFKLFIGAFFLACAYAIGKISKIINLKNPLLPVAAFSLNPFVILESLVSSHNDIVMMGFCMMGVWFLLENKNFKGSAMLLVSAGMKYATIVLFFMYYGLKIINREKLFIPYSIVLMIGAVVLAVIRTNFQPWYMLFVIPFAVLYIEKKFMLYPLLVVSIGCIIYYIPFLYTGNWDPPIPLILNTVVIGCSVLALALFTYYRLRENS